MHTVKNLKVNTNAINKKRKLKLIALALAITIVVTGSVLGGIAIAEGMEQNKLDAIVEYYGEDSKEDRLLEYIEISEDLDGLDIGECIVSDNLYEKHNISKALMQPKEIKKLIEKYNDMQTFTDSKNTIKQSENIDTILSLINQKRLVNSYISREGTKIAYENVTEASKKYAAEVFGLDEDNITFKIITGTSTTPDNIVITNTTTDKYGIKEKRSYTIDEFIASSSLGEIKDGVYNMGRTDGSFDNYDTNKERNKNIIDALKQSVDMNEERREEDLYNERLAAKMK